MNTVPIFKAIPAWVMEYGKAGNGDQRALEDFMTCEAREGVTSLKNELIAVSAGLFHEPTFDKIVGLDRKQKHGGFENWAKIMLLWMASYKG